MNRMQFDELVYQLAIVEDLVSSDVHGRLRTLSRDDATLNEFLKPIPTQNGAISLAQRVDMMRKVWSEASPVERGIMRLTALESGLRGRLADALLHLELSAPGDLRDAMKQAQDVGGNNHPNALVEAIAFLRDAGYDPEKLAAFEATRLELYPPDPDDIEPPAPEVVS